MANQIQSVAQRIYDKLNLFVKIVVVKLLFRMLNLRKDVTTVDSVVYWVKMNLLNL